MSTKHTPGPWHVEKRVGRYEIWPKDNGQTHSNVGIAQTEADAGLFAAAPELLEALRLVDNDYETEGCNGCGMVREEIMEKVRAAIAKATESGVQS